MPSRKIEDLDPVLAFAFGKALVEFILSHPDGPVPFLTCTYRSDAEQTALYNQPFDKKDNNGNGKIDEPGEKVTNAKAGQSPHNYKLSMALDVAFQSQNGKTDWSDEHFKDFALLMKKTPGVTWGGDFKSFKDQPHFERTGWEKLVKKG